MYLFFDTETTGLPLSYNASVEDLDNWPRLVQLAWLIYDENKKEKAKANYIIKPEGFEIPEQASAVHGITTEMARQNGSVLRSVLEHFANDLNMSKLIVAHNLSFDEKIIGAEFLRKKIKHRLFDAIRVCTMKESTNFCQLSGNSSGYKWPRLTELHMKLFAEDFTDAHDALADVKACARCFFEMAKRRIIKY